MRKIESAVVTGPTGAIGHALCSLLMSRGVRVYAVCHRGSTRADSLAVGEGLVRVDCDLSELSGLPGMMETVADGADAFFHLAWSHTTGQGRNDMTAQLLNVRATLDACHAAKELGCSVFVGAGSQAEYGRVAHALTPDTPCFPENGYGMAKLCAGQMSRVECDSLGVDHVWPRVLSVYGPHDGEGAMIPFVSRALLAGEKPALTGCEQLWDYLYADDAAEAFFAMALHGRNGAVYPVGGGRARPLRMYVEELRDAVDPSLPIGFGEIPYASKQVMHLEADIGALQADTGFVPATDFATGIRKTLKWMKSQSR